MQAAQLSFFETNKQRTGVGSEFSHSPQYLHIAGKIPIDLPDGAFISVDRKKPLKIHAIGFQPAKTIPEIPNWFLRKYTSVNATVLEPFAGSGTSVVETLHLERNAAWLDYQPLSQMICRLKTTIYQPLSILEKAKQILSTVSQIRTAPSNVTFRNKDFWFQKPVQAGLELLRAQIFQCDDQYRLPLLAAFASTVRKCSDMNDGMILAARRSSVEAVPERTRSDVFRYFRMYVEKVVGALAEWNVAVDISDRQVMEISSHDARQLDGQWECDAIVTSPPYINAIDYVWAAKFELHWLGLVKNDRERLSLYSKEIGTERIPSKVYKELGKLEHPDLDRMMEDIYTGRLYKASKGQNKLRARVVYQYFVDMREHFAASYGKLRSGGYYCFSIGDASKICGVTIPAASLLAEFATQTGFVEDFRFHLLLKNRRLNIPRNVDWAGTIKHDTVVVMQKP